MAVGGALRGFLLELGGELSSLVAGHWREVAPYVAFFFALHAALEFGVPAAWPGAYDALARAGGGKPDRRALARDARTKLLASAMALEVTALSLAGLARADERALFADLYGSTPLTAHLVRVAVGYFTWDVVACVLDGAAPAYHAHGWACLFVFVAALRPFLHYMAMVALAFEASTPFLHARTTLIATGRATGAAFHAVQAAFAATFFLSRIANGYWQFGRWWGLMQALVASGRAHSVAVVRVYQALCVFLCALNGYWFALIVYKGLAGGGRRAATPRADAKKAA